MLRISSWRFQLSTLLLVITVTALGLALFISQRQQRKLAAENRLLNALLGRPNITDPERIAVGYDARLSHLNLAFNPDEYRGITNNFIYRHRFCIYQPPNRRLTVRCAFGDDNGELPQNADKFDLHGLGGKEILLDVLVRFDRTKSLEVEMEARNAEPELHSSAVRMLQTGAEYDHWIFAAPYGKDSQADFRLSGFPDQPVPPEPDTPTSLLGYIIDLNDGSPLRYAVLVWIEDDNSAIAKAQ